MRAIFVEKVIPKMLAVNALKGLWAGVVWSPLSPLRVEDLQEPGLPGPRWLRVRNLQCGVCATDLTLLNVDVHPSIAPAALPGNTRIFLGHEVVSEVVEVGEGVSRFSVGDRVVMQSRHAGSNCLTQDIDPRCKYCAQGETRLCENASLGRGPVGEGGGWGDGYTAHESEVWPVPADLDDDQASLVEPTAVALHGVLRRPPKPGDKVLVIGAGIIGLQTIQAVKIVDPDCHVTALARYPQQVAMARELGAEEVLTDGDLYEQVARITGAKHYTFPLNPGMLLGGFDVIYDCVGNEKTLLNALRWARAGGVVVMVGVKLASVKIDLNPIWYQEVDLIGSAFFGMEDWQGERVHTFDIVIEQLQKGVLTCKGLITHRFPFEEYKRAVAAASDKSTGSIKVVFEY